MLMEELMLVCRGWLTSLFERCVEILTMLLSQVTSYLPKECDGADSSETSLRVKPGHLTDKGMITNYLTIAFVSLRFLLNK